MAHTDLARKPVAGITAKRKQTSQIVRRVSDGFMFCAHSGLTDPEVGGILAR